jgi:segregation and condensation protein B
MSTSPDRDEPPESDLARSVEAILLTTDRAVSAGRLAETIGSVHGTVLPEQVDAAVESLNEAYARERRSFRIEPVAGGYRLMTLPEVGAVLAAFHSRPEQPRLSRAAVETLSIIAYRQPITRGKIEAIRGVGCGEVLRSLLEMRLVTIRGRAEELGRPMLYGTTREFLDALGLKSPADLPENPELASAEAG